MAERELSPHQERAAERLLEDEGLTADLNDDQAAVMIQWASAQAIAAATLEQSDAALTEALERLRTIVRQVARTHPAAAPQQLVAYAEALLKPSSLGHADVPVQVQPSIRILLNRHRISLTTYRVS